MITRRQLLRGGLTTLAVGGAATGVRSVDQGVFAVGDGPAYDLWSTWDLGGGIEPVLAAAVLASNPHDSQAWQFRVDTGDAVNANGRPRSAVIDVFLDPNRTIGSVDSLLREAHMGLGCAVENMTVVASSLGYRPTVTLLPGSEPNLVARVELESGPEQPSVLAGAVPRRHTNRHAFRTDQDISTSELKVLDAVSAGSDEVSVRWLTAASDMTTFREQTIAATEAFIADAEMSADSRAWFRHSWDELQAEASGLTYDGSVSAPLAAVFKTGPDFGEAAANAGWLSATRSQVATAPLAGILVARRSEASQSDQRRQWLAAGRHWQRLHLAATVQGVVAQPLNQLAELTDREQDQGSAPRFGDVLSDLGGGGDVISIMPFRIGHPTRSASATPRRPLAEVVRYD